MNEYMENTAWEAAEEKPVLRLPQCREEMETMQAYWEKYTPREQRVLTMLIGLGGVRPHTPEEVAAEYRVSTARIYQIAAKALHKPYRIHRTRPMRDFLD